MNTLYDEVCAQCSKITTRSYSTSFSLGIRLLHTSLRPAIYNIYGFVRFADEIVDTFHTHKKDELLKRFRGDTYRAIEEGISLNPILHSFQAVVNRYHIERELIAAFLHSMEMDLEQKEHSQASYEEYILGSAEVVGLMCLRVFTDGDETFYQALKPEAMRLGAAFQKVNFLRDLKADAEGLGRTYFPGVDLSRFGSKEKIEIEQDIQADFDEALKGIKKLPRTSRFGVYLAYTYYLLLFKKIKNTSPERIKQKRIRISNPRKFGILVNAYVRYNLQWL
jgi:15-cis-phytoene synthase